MIKQVFTLWIGEALSPLEQLCLRSFVAHGHEVTLYSYSPIAGVPAGVAKRAADDVLPAGTRDWLLGPRPAKSLTANLFRLYGLKRGAGLWVDADVACLRPIDLTDGMIAGWESDTYINNAVLYLEPDSPILADLLMFMAPSMFPPWARPWWRTLPLAIRDLQEKAVYPSDFPRGTFGPKGLTAMAQKHGMAHLAAAPEVFYPLHPRRASDAFQSGLRLADLVTPESRTIHLWNEKIVDFKHTAPRGSIISELLDRYP